MSCIVVQSTVPAAELPDLEMTDAHPAVELPDLEMTDTQPNPQQLPPRYSLCHIHLLCSILRHVHHIQKPVHYFYVFTAVAMTANASTNR